MSTERMEWSPQLEIGHVAIDRQHKKLFDLAASLVADRDQVRVMRTLAALSEYVIVHFRDEEKLMQEIGFPEFEAHKTMHDGFRNRLAKLYANASGMTLDQIAEEVRSLINEWLALHIMIIDREYIAYLPRQTSAA